MVQRNLGNLISVSFLGRLVGNALQYSIYVVIGRYLGARSLGLFTFGFVVLNVGTMVSRIGMDKAVKKFLPVYRTENDNQKLTGTLLLSLVLPCCLATLLSFGVFLGSDFLGQYFSESLGSTTLLFLAGIPFMTLMTVGRAATTGFLETKYSVYIKDIGQSVAAIVFVLLGSIVIGSVEAVIIGYVASLVISAGLALYYLYRLGGFDGIASPVFEVRKVLFYAVPLTIAAVAQYLVSWTDVLMLGALGTASGIGRYQAAYQTAVILVFLLGAANSIFPSVASSLYDKGQMKRLQEMYAALTKWITYLTSLGFLFMIINAAAILSLFGNEFVGSVRILGVLAGALTLNTAVGPAGFLLMMAGYERTEMTNTIIAAVTNIVLNYMLIQEFGVLGAAIATGCSLVLVNLLRLGQIWHRLGIRPLVSDYWKGGLAIAIAVPLMYVGQYVSVHYIIGLIASGVLALGTFLVVIFLIGIDTNDQRLIEEIS